MKRLKNISLAYILQIFAVLILFFYPDYSSKAALRARPMNKAVKENKAPFTATKKSSTIDKAGASALNSLGFMWAKEDK